MALPVEPPPQPQPKKAPKALREQLVLHEEECQGAASEGTAFTVSAGSGWSTCRPRGGSVASTTRQETADRLEYLTSKQEGLWDAKSADEEEPAEDLEGFFNKRATRGDR